MRDLATVLAELDAFEVLEREHLEELAGCSRIVRYRAGERVFAEGDAARSCHVVRRGRIALAVHGVQRGSDVIATYGAGQIVGWSWLFPPYRWQFDARATLDSSAIVMDAACVRSKCDADPRFGYALVKRVAALALDRLQATRLQLLDLYAGDGR